MIRSEGDPPPKQLFDLIFANDPALNSIQTSTNIPLTPIQPVLEESLLIPHHALYIPGLPLIQ